MYCPCSTILQSLRFEKKVKKKRKRRKRRRRRRRKKKTRGGGRRGGGGERERRGGRGGEGIGGGGGGVPLPNFINTNLKMPRSVSSANQTKRWFVLFTVGAPLEQQRLHTPLILFGSERA
jgi:hypothetical protein